MALLNPNFVLTGLPRRLVTEGLLSEAAARAAWEHAQKKRISLVSHLVESKQLDSRTLVTVASDEFGVPLFDLSAMELDMDTVQLVEERLIRQHRALPLFRRGHRLYVAVSDPTNLQAIDEFKFHTGINTDAVLVEEDKLAKVIERVLEARDTTMRDMIDADLERIDIQGGDEAGAGDFSEPDVDDAPVVRYVNKVLLDAITKGASDIHFEPYEREFRVRFRQDGILYEIAQPPIHLAARIGARLKVMSRMDIAERRVPQDGRIKMSLSKTRTIDFRVNSCPTLFGEKIVLRILDPTQAQLGIDLLGYEEGQRRLFLEAIARPWGMILVTGPTGSGKTVSLYTALNILNSTDRNISTVEDPVEIFVPGINQVNTNPKAGLTFATALRAFLRQDPDIIMVGEIRDLETAEIAVKAAQTGHLVLSTVHTNDAPQTLTRLGNMGVAPFNIASAVHLIIAQRLARRLCNLCKREEKIPAESLLKEGFREDEIERIKVFGPAGCEHCTNGYKGRIGIFQVMPVSEDMGRIIMEDGNALELGDQARREGVRDLRDAGLEKVRAGITSLEEINRVTKD